MKKITKITKEQKAEIPAYIKKWVDLASQPIDRGVAMKRIEGLYKKGKPLVVFAESLDNLVNLIRLSLALSGKKIGQLRSQLHSQLRSQRSQLRSQLHSQLDSQLDSQLHSQLRSQLHSQLRSQLRSQLDSQLHSQLDSQLRSQLDDANWNWYVSYYWQSWCGYCDYGKSIGVQFDLDKLQEFYDFILNMPIVVFVGNVLFICEKPQVLWDAEGRLHSERHPAIGWKDDTGFYYLHGVRFEKDLWEKVISGKMLFKEIVGIENTEHRLQAMRYNPSALTLENPKLIHQSERGNEL